MRLFVYFIVAAVALIIIKAFFLDDYLANRDKPETNVSVEAVEPEKTVEEKPAAPVASAETNESLQNTQKKEIQRKQHKDMPLDRLGDSIADKLNL